MIYTGPIKRPGILSVGIIPRRVYASNLHPIAVARINAIYAAGGSCPVGASTAKRLLSAFIRAEESAGRWPALKLLFIPGFGNASANAINIVTGGSGSFSASGMTHSNGFAQSNGSTGFFDIGTSMAAIGQTITSAWIGYLALNNISPGLQQGAQQDGANRNSVFNPGGNSFDHGGFNGGNGRITSTTVLGQIGITSFIAEPGFYSLQRRTASNLILDRQAKTGGVNVSTINSYAWARNNNGVLGNQTTAQLGAHWYGTGVTTAQDAEFTANLRTLWQSLFQLSLP